MPQNTQFMCTVSGLIQLIGIRKYILLKKIQYLKTDIVQIQRSKLQISNPPVNAVATVTAHNRETIRLGMLLYHISNLSVANTGFHCIANKTDTWHSAGVDPEGGGEAYLIILWHGNVVSIRREETLRNSPSVQLYKQPVL